MLHTMTRPIPTVQDRAKAKRLRTLWERLKGDLHLTQVSAAKQLGITQPTLSQYLNAVISLNTDTVFKFAELLRVDPVEIDPSLKGIYSLRTYRQVKMGTVNIPYIGSTSGRPVMGEPALKTEQLPDDGTYAGILVDTNYLLQAGIPNGSTIVLDLQADPLVPHRNVVVRLRGDDGFYLMKYLSSSATTIRVQNPAENNKLQSFRLTQIAQMHLVYQITMPS